MNSARSAIITPAFFIVVGLQQPRCIGEMSQYSTGAEVTTYQRTCSTAVDCALLLMQAYVLPTDARSVCARRCVEAALLLRLRMCSPHIMDSCIASAYVELIMGCYCRPSLVSHCPASSNRRSITHLSAAA
jgi:hypothetical protein